MISLNTCYVSSFSLYSLDRRSRMIHFGLQDDYLSPSPSDDQDDLDSIREKLEVQIDEGKRYYPELDVCLPPSQPLTATQCVDRVAEMKIVKKLSNGDECIPEIWDLWFRERGPEAASVLYRADALINEGPRRWNEAEKILRSLIEQHGVYWSEPVNRLATLTYLQGRLDESERLCKTVLAVKPWHFGALSGIVLVYVGMKDPQSALSWVNRRLPSFIPNSPNHKRREWVETALKQADCSLFNTDNWTHMEDEDDKDDNNAWQ